MRYLKGTSEKEMCFTKTPNEKLQLHAYSDADWAADTTDRRSTTGYCVSLNENGPLISWKTKKQSVQGAQSWGLTNETHKNFKEYSFL